MRYLIYLRVSTGKQEDSGLGLEAQKHSCTEWIKKQSVQGEVLEYQDIVTGTDRQRKELEDRPQLAALISNIMQGDIVIALKRERVSRDSFVIALIEREIEKKGGKLVCANGEMDGDEPHDLLMRRILDAFAEYEALMISVRTKAALSRKKAKGERIGHIPYGYKLDSNKNLIVNPQEYKALEYMYELRLQKKWTFRTIATTMNSLGYRNRPKDGVPSPWTHGAVSRVVWNWPRVLADHACASEAPAASSFEPIREVHQQEALEA